MNTRIKQYEVLYRRLPAGRTYIPQNVLPAGGRRYKFMKNIPDSLSPQEAWNRLSSYPRLSPEIRPLTDSLGLYLENDLHVPEDVPAANRSFMDGFAVRSKDVSAAPVKLRIVGEILMGAISEQKVNSGETMFIPTGGFLPEGADAVVMQENTSRNDESVLINKAVSPNENVQLRAEDFRRDEVLFPASHRLRTQDLGALATFGITEISVIRRPGVAIISTGNELVEFHSKPEQGQIRETNALSLTAACRQYGFQVHTLGIVRDELEPQKEAMTEALSRADVVLVSGGSSVGERDYTLEVIRLFPDSNVVFHGLAIRPGNPTIFASIGRQWVFGLPGQPVSSLVVFYQFVLPFLCHLSGEDIEFQSFFESKFKTVPAYLEESIKPLSSKTDYVRLRLRQQHEKWFAKPVLGKSASLSTLSRADAFTVVAPGGDTVAEGSQIIAILFP
ncbi:molybdopterin molybdotransferase MoeA [bacterium]|nr:molybdopterin molybdotransferase MoeA [bacterium]